MKKRNATVREWERRVQEFQIGLAQVESVVQTLNDSMSNENVVEG